MSHSRNRLLHVAALGIALGLTASLMNSWTTPPARFGAYFLNAGWLWAGVAVAAGARFDSRTLSGCAGAAALLATTTSYYCMDAVVRQESLVMYWPEMRGWWLVSVAVGPLLGSVGRRARRPGVGGRLAGLVVPVGAAVEMAWNPRWSSDPTPDPVLLWVRVLVGAASVLAVVVLLGRPSRARHPADSSFPGTSRRDHRAAARRPPTSS